MSKFFNDSSLPINGKTTNISFFNQSWRNFSMFFILFLRFLKERQITFFLVRFSTFWIMTLQVKEIAMTKWTQCRNANFVVTKNASRAFEKHEELLNRNFWTNLLYHRNWHFHTMFTKSLRFLSLESQFTKRTKSYKTEPTR